MVFSNTELDENTLSKDRWIILKISNDLTELTYIAGRKLEQEKEINPQFWAEMMEPEKEMNPHPENAELLEQDNSEAAIQHEIDN